MCFCRHCLIAPREAYNHGQTHRSAPTSLAKGALLFLFNKKRSTPFHKEILPTFTKQLRKNYTIIPSIKGHANISTFFIPAKLFKDLFKKFLRSTFFRVSTQAVTLEMLCHK